MIRLTKVIQFILQFAWNGWHKINVQFPAYVLVRIRTHVNPNIKQAYRSR